MRARHGIGSRLRAVVGWTVCLAIGGAVCPGPESALAQPLVSAPVEVTARGDGSAMAFRVPGGAGLPAEVFLALHGHSLGLGPEDELEPIGGLEPITAGLYRRAYRQLHRGLEVIGGRYVLIESELGVASGNGRIISGLAVDVEATGVGESAVKVQALAAAATAVDAGEPTGEVACRPVLAPRKQIWRAIAYRLAWRCEVVRPEPWPATIVDVDDRFGRVLFLDTGVRRAWVDGPASGPTLYHGYQTFTAQHEAGTWRLRQGGETPVWTRDAQGGVDPAAAQEVASPDNTFDDPAHPFPVSAHFGVTTALEYFLAAHERDGWNGQGGEISAYVDWGASPAQYLGNGSIAFDEPPSLDVCAHEVAHAVLDGKLTYTGESAALNEAFANMFAMAVEESTGIGTAWVFGEAENPGSPLDFVVPKAQGWPDVYQGLNWADPINDQSCVQQGDFCAHENSGPATRWFGLLFWSGSGNLDDDPNQPLWEVEVGLPLEDGAPIAYVGWMDFLFPSAGYPDARVATDLAADLLFGRFSRPFASAQQAWGAVGVGSVAADEPVTVPAHGALDVNPWVVDFEWEMGTFDMGEWEVRVALDPQGEDAVAEGTTQDVTADLARGRLAGIALQPATSYYWKVRSTEEGKLWWWEPRGFTTDDMIPVVGAPNGLAHPWKLPFHLAVEPGTRFVDIQVAYDHDFGDLVFPTKSFPIEDGAVLADLVLELTVPMDEDLVWRARARRDEAGDNASDWSVVQGFRTEIPKATALEPSTGEVYPWPVELTWDLPGAEEFDVAIASLPDPDFAWEAAHGGLTSPSLALDLPGTFWVQQIFYEWTVGAIGPRLGSELQPEEKREDAERSDPATFMVNGNPTLPQLIEPEWGSNDPWCFEPGDPVTFRWGTVQNADEYRLRVVEMRCLLTEPPTPCQPSDVVVHDERLAGTERTLSSGSQGNISGPFTHGDHVGYAWGVQAYAGEGEVPGVMADREEYFLWPDVPGSLAPFGETLERGSPVQLSWQSQVAHGGDFVVSIYRGSGCSGSLLDSFVVHDAKATTKHGGWDEEENQYSWRVHPFVYTACGGQGFVLQWSDCADFSLEAADPELPPPDVVNLGHGTIGAVLVIFSVVEDADNYHIEVREGSETGPVVLDETFSDQLLHQHKLDVANQLSNLGEPVPQPFLPGWWVAVIGNAQPVNHYYYKVQACAGSECGEFSDWAEWLETIPWPF